MGQRFNQILDDAKDRYRESIILSFFASAMMTVYLASGELREDARRELEAENFILSEVQHVDSDVPIDFTTAVNFLLVQAVVQKLDEDEDLAWIEDECCGVKS